MLIGLSADKVLLQVFTILEYLLTMMLSGLERARLADFLFLHSVANDEGVEKRQPDHGGLFKVHPIMDLIINQPWSTKGAFP